MSRKGSSKYPQEEIDRWHAYYLECKSVKRTAIHFKVSWGVVYHQFRNRGWILPTKGEARFQMSVEDGLKCAEFFKAGVAMREIVRRIGHDHKTVEKRLRLLGVLTTEPGKGEPVKYGPEFVESLRVDYEKTQSTRITGTNFGINGAQVHCLLKPLGIVPDLWHTEEQRAESRLRLQKERHEELKADPKKFLQVSLKKHHGDGFSDVDYNRMLEEQDGKCACCGDAPDPNAERLANRRLFVDHDHITHEVRQLLCFACNAGLGKFKDEDGRDCPELLEKAAAYLEKPPSIFVSNTTDVKTAKRTNSISSSHPLYSWANAVAKKYGITIAQVQEMETAQGGVCAICRKPPSTHPFRLSIDHNHGTRDVRGLLDSDCNIGIGNFYDSPALLRKAAAYLRRHEQRRTESDYAPLYSRKTVKFHDNAPAGIVDQ